MPPSFARAGLSSPQLLSRRDSPRYRRLDLGVLSIRLIHFGTVYSVLDLGGRPPACRHYGQGERGLVLCRSGRLANLLPSQVRIPYIAVAGLGKASRLSPQLRELLAHLADDATELVDDLPIDRAVFREATGQGGGASWRHARHGARLLTYSPFFSYVPRRHWGTSYFLGVRGSGMMRHIRRVLPGGRSSLAGDPVEFFREVGWVLPGGQSSFAGGQSTFAGLGWLISQPRAKSQSRSKCHFWLQLSTSSSDWGLIGDRLTARDMPGQ